MLTRNQKKVNNQIKYQKHKKYHQYWFQGKKFTNLGVRYPINESNYYLKDRCDGYVYEKYDYCVGKYTGPQTRAMTKYISRRNYMNRKLNRYYQLLKLKRTRAMTEYLKYYHYKYFRFSDQSINHQSI